MAAKLSLPPGKLVGGAEICTEKHTATPGRSEHHNMKQIPATLFTTLLFVSVMAVTVEARDRKARRTKKTANTEQYAASVAKPTLSEVAYGTNERHVLDFWMLPLITDLPIFIREGLQQWWG